MCARRLPVALVLLAVLAWPGASWPGAPGKLKVLAEVDIHQRTESPTFYASSAPRLMAGDSRLYLGHGMWQEQDRFELLDLKTLERLTVRAPLAAFIETRQDLFPGARGTGWPQAYTDRLLFYDPAHGRAGILYRDSYAQGHDRSFYLHWDLAQNRITEAVELARNPGRQTWLDVKPIGYRAETGALYLEIRLGAMDRQAPEAEEVQVVSVTGSRVVVLARFTTRRKIFPGPFYDPIHHQALVVEYAELPLEGPEPLGYLIHLNTGQVDRVHLPETCYGVAFSPDGRKLYAYSNQRGQLWSISLPDGAYSRPVKLGDHGHALGWVRPGVLLLIRSEGLWTITPGLKKGRFWPTSQIAAGPFHVERSLVQPDRALVVDGQRLFVVALPR